MGVEYRRFLIPEENDWRPSPEGLARLLAAMVDAGFVRRTEADPFPEPYSYDQARKNLGFEELHMRQFEESGLCELTPANADYRPWPCPCTAADLARLGETDYRLGWHVEDLAASGLVYPLSRSIDHPEIYYDLDLLLGDDFIYETSESIDPFPPYRDLACRCGEILEYWPEGDESRDGWVDFNACRIRRICPRCGRGFRPQEHTAVLRECFTGARRERPGGATFRFALHVDCGKCHPYGPEDLAIHPKLVEIVTETLGRSFYEVGTIA